MSYNNFLDANAAWACVSSFSETAVSIIKHTNPCGMALHPNPLKAFLDALSGDPVSSFGGIVAINSPVTISMAKEIVKIRCKIVKRPHEPCEISGLPQRFQWVLIHGI